MKDIEMAGVVGAGIAIMILLLTWIVATPVILFGGAVFWCPDFKAVWSSKRSWLVAAGGAAILPILAILGNLRSSFGLVGSFIGAAPNAISSLILFSIAWGVLALLCFVLIRSWAKPFPTVRIVLSTVLVVGGMGLWLKPILGAAKIAI